MFHDSVQAKVTTPAKRAHDGLVSAAAAEVRLEANEDPQVPAVRVTDVVYAFCMASNSGACAGSFSAVA